MLPSKLLEDLLEKKKVISFKNSYHGTTGLSIQTTGFPGVKKGLFLDGDVFLLIFYQLKKKQKRF